MKNIVNNRYVVVWDMYGIEYVASIDKPSRQKMWAKLKGDDHTKIQIPNLNHLMLRAKVNSQRNYEIYIIQVEDSITENDILKMFNDNPQMSADTIRRIGTKVYGEPLSESQKPVIV